MATSAGERRAEPDCADTRIELPAPLRVRLWEAGWYVKDTYRLYPPRDTGPASETELLFVGTERRHMGAEPRMLTAYVPNDLSLDVLVGEEW